ncbi:MAG: hypothetical protein AAF519_18770 [Bacteroidota bacterium]
MMSYKIKLCSIPSFYGLLILLMFSSCSDDDSTTPTVESENKTTGFVSVGVTSSGNSVVKYFEELPTGTVDLSDGTDFISFFPTSVYDGAIFTRRTDGSPGISKIAVNAEGEFIEEGTIPLSGAASTVAVRDSLIGVCNDFANPDAITVFNPTTFEVTGSIDMSAGSVPDGAQQESLRFMFRGDDMFIPIRNVNGSFFMDFVVHQANLATNTFVGDTRREGDGSISIEFQNGSFGQRLTDAAGNLYIPDAGNIEDGGIAHINKVPVGSNEIDPTYIFQPALTLNPQNFLGLIFRDFTFLEGGKAIARVNSETPEAVLIILAASGGNPTPEQLAEIQSIIFEAETGVWCEIDVDAMTVIPIAGIPNFSLLQGAGGNVFEYNGDAYIPAFNAEEDAYYQWNPTTGTVSKAFVVTGVNSPRFFNLANDI